MKKQTYISLDKFRTILAELGIEYIEQSAFLKISGAVGRNVYVAKQVRVGRVDLSGFEVDASLGVIDLKGESVGAVRQWMDFTLPEETILDNFRKILQVLRSLPPREILKRKAPGTPTPRIVVEAPATPEELAAVEEKRNIRRILLQKVAAEKGVAISDKAGI